MTIFILIVKTTRECAPYFGRFESRLRHSLVSHILGSKTEHKCQVL